MANELKQLYWQFKGHGKSLLITSDEPWIPWEMIKPYCYNNGKTEQDPFWCQQFAIFRWLSGPSTADELPMKIIVPVASLQSNLSSVKAKIAFLEQLHDLLSRVKFFFVSSQISFRFPKPETPEEIAFKVKVVQLNSPLCLVSD